MNRVKNLCTFYNVQDMVIKMKFYGIGKVVVYHSLAWEYTPQLGNIHLLEEIGEYNCLTPVWVIMPHYTSEFPELLLLIKHMKDRIVRAVRMFLSNFQFQNTIIITFNFKYYRVYRPLHECAMDVLIHKVFYLFRTKYEINQEVRAA